MHQVLAYMFKLLNYYKYGEKIVNSFNKLLNLQIHCQTDDRMYDSQLSDLTKLTAFLYCVSNFAWCVACSNTFLGANVQLPVPSEYPFDWRNDKLYFWIAFLHQSLAGIILVNSNIGMDCFAYYLMGMVTAHFKMLQTHIQSIGSGVDEIDRQNAKELEISSLSIRLCIDEHQRILEFENLNFSNDNLV